MTEQENTNEHELTWGEKQAGVTFNPSAEPLIDEIKGDFAKLFDKLNSLRSSTDNGDKKRFYSMALTHMNDAQMDAVKAITWRY
jgi:hypothetical protein